jgi:hypothetical protein
LITLPDGGGSETYLRRKRFDRLADALLDLSRLAAGKLPKPLASYKYIYWGASETPIFGPEKASYSRHG